MVCWGVTDAQRIMESRFQRVNPLLLKMKPTSCDVGPLEALHLDREASGTGLGQARMTVFREVSWTEDASVFFRRMWWHYDSFSGRLCRRYVRSCSTYLSHDIQWCVPSDTPHSSDKSSLTLGMSRKYSTQVCPERKAVGGGKGQRQRVWIRDDKFLPESRKRNFRRNYGSKLAGKL